MSDDPPIPLDPPPLESVRDRIAADEPVHHELPGGGRLHLDRQLPFLCVYRPSMASDPGIESLVKSTASHFIAPVHGESRSQDRDLVATVVERLSSAFGAFLILEIGPADLPTGQLFRIRQLVPSGYSPFAEELRRELMGVSRKFDEASTIEIRSMKSSPLLSRDECSRLQCTVLAIEIAPFCRDPETQAEYPELLRELRRAFDPALQRAVHHFSCSHTRHCPIHYHMLGRRAVDQTVWTVDECLAEVSQSFDFLLQVTPTNSQEAWAAFGESRFERAPVFRYRPLPWDPVTIKRQIWSAPVEGIEDVTLSDLFRQKQDELDRQVNLLLDLESPRFVLGATQIFGEVDAALLGIAHRVLDPTGEPDPGEGDEPTVGAEEFAVRARAEVEAYREQWSDFPGRVEVRADVTRGLLVSKDRLLIGADTTVSVARVDALIHHEVGTHLLTHANGQQQGFRILAAGLAGYDPFQEGIAVLAEYLCAGLTRNRLRLLAARVLAVRSMLDGASFVDVHRLLRERGFEERTAFTIAMRVFRGGGLTKDAAYLRGLDQVLGYLHAGGSTDLLWLGKFGANHTGVIEELLTRGVLSAPKVRPHFLELPGAPARLSALRAGMQVWDL